MHGLVARNPKQLDLCLRLLYAENVDFVVKVNETEKRKIFYTIYVKTDEHNYELLREKYRILIS